MKIIAFILTLSFLTLNAKAASLICTSHDGKTQMTQYTYTGLAKPAPGLETFRIVWKHGLREVGSLSNTHGKAGRLGVIDENSKIDIETIENTEDNTKTAVYVIKAEVPTSTGGVDDIVATTLLCQLVTPLK